MKFIFILFAAWLFSFAASGRCATTQSSRCKNFITVKGDKEFRFISYNIPNLHYVEDNMAFNQTIPFRFADEFEIRDALLSIRQSGGQVALLSCLLTGQIIFPAKANTTMTSRCSFPQTLFRGE